MASPTVKPTNFAALLKTASTQKVAPSVKSPPVFHAANVAALTRAEFVPGGPAPLSRSEMLKTADQLMNVLTPPVEHVARLLSGPETGSQGECGGVETDHVIGRP